MNAVVMPSPEPRRVGFASGAVPRVRLSMTVRKRDSRRAARRRVATLTTKALTAEQRVLERPIRYSAVARAAKAVSTVLGSAAAHAAVVLLGMGVAALKTDGVAKGPSQVSIEVREREPPRAKQVPKPPPPEAPIAETPRRAQSAESPTPREKRPVDTPQEPPQGLPKRVVGIALEATVEGGNGLSFAVGQTRMGETPERANQPLNGAAERAPAEAPSSARGASSPNQVASRIPTAKAEQKLPVRRRPRVPPYPAIPRSQGIEADVTVMVTLDESGAVTGVRIITPSAYPAFNESARAAALVEEFEPALRDGVPVPYTLSYTYRFRIEEK